MRIAHRFPTRDLAIGVDGLPRPTGDSVPNSIRSVQEPGGEPRQAPSRVPPTPPPEEEGEGEARGGG